MGFFFLFLFLFFSELNLINFISWQDVDGGGSSPRTRLLETEYETMPFGETGDGSLTSMPFQVYVLISFELCLYLLD